MTLTKHRDYYKPFDYPWAFEAYEDQQNMHWLPSEVPLHEDIADWKKNLSDAEKNLLTQIFRFFTQGDIDIARGYYDLYIPMFKPPEIRMMLGSFAAMEAVHTHAYSLLLDTVGMLETEYKAFQEYEEMSEKHSYLFEKRSDFKNWKEKLLLEMAIFSAFGEGLQLFSSFAILMNFPRHNKMKGMGQIVTWSIKDETLHVEGMIKLFHAFLDENKKVWTDDFKKLIYQACRDMVQLEDKFIDLAFEMGPIEGLTKEELKKYIRYIADRRLLQLGLKPNYRVKENPLPWLEEMLGAVEHANFFEQRATEYSRGGLQGNIDDAF